MLFREVARIFRKVVFAAITLFILYSLCGQPVQAAEDQNKEAEKVYDIGGDVQAPKLIHVVEPEFDPKSEDAFTTGAVKIQIVITAKGEVRNPKVLTGNSAQQNKKAADAVLQWRFKPGQLNGKPVSVRATVEVNFHLL